MKNYCKEIFGIELIIGRFKFELSITTKGNEAKSNEPETEEA